MTTSHNEFAEIKRFTDHNENTMNQFVSCSVGMAILKLMNDQLKGKEKTTLDDTCQTCLNALKKTGEETKDESLKFAITYMLAKVEEPSGTLDSVTLYLPDPDKQGEYKEERYLFSLKQVLTLVYNAMVLNKGKFEPGYYGNDKNELEKANKKDAELRKENFYTCLKRIALWKKCHQGVRNELVSLLNKTYDGVVIIEDLSFVLYAALKESINTLYWSRASSGTIKEKQALNAAYLEWMDTQSPAKLIALLDPQGEKQKEWKNNLKSLLIKHGVNPAIHNVDALVDEKIKLLPFTCESGDKTRDQAHLKMHAILSQDKLPYQDKRNAALKVMQQWVKESCRPLEEKSQTTLHTFCRIEDAYQLWQKYSTILRLSKCMEETFNHFPAQCEAYFESFSKESQCELNTDSLLLLAGKIQQSINSARQDALTTPIENFFAQWYGATNPYNKEQLITLYGMLLNEETAEKIRLNKEEVNKLLHSSKKDSHEIEITPYLINRIFLHAILTKPADWEESFDTLFNKVLSFVKNRLQEEDHSSESRKDEFIRTSLFCDCYQKSELMCSPFFSCPDVSW